MDISQALEHCRELALQPGSMFEFTSQFMPEVAKPPLLAVYALKQAITSIPYAATDDMVKWEKLKWWGQQLLADSGSTSGHPVILALVATGAWERLDQATLVRLVSSALEQVDAAPDSDEEAMRERFSAAGLAETCLELSLDGAGFEPEAFAHLSAASTLFGVIASLVPGRQAQATRLPLNALAKHGVTTEMFEVQPYPAEVQRLLEDIIELALSWYAQGLEQAPSGSNGVAESHLRLRWALERRHLKRLRDDTRRLFRKGLSSGPRDAFFAWRFLRGLN